jgi:transposase
MTKRTNKHYPVEFKQEAVALVIEQDYPIVQAAASLGVTDKLLYNWVAKHKKQAQGDVLSGDERAARRKKINPAQDLSEIETD